MVIQQVIPYQPERVTHIYAQIRNVCNPGRNVTVQSWKAEEGKVFFNLIDSEGRVLLTNCLFEYSV
jgi:hypothetical protein